MLSVCWQILDGSQRCIRTQLTRLHSYHTPLTTHPKWLNCEHATCGFNFEPTNCINIWMETQHSYIYDWNLYSSATTSFAHEVITQQEAVEAV